MQWWGRWGLHFIQISYRSLDQESEERFYISPTCSLSNAWIKTCNKSTETVLSIGARGTASVLRATCGKMARRGQRPRYENQIYIKAIDGPRHTLCFNTTDFKLATLTLIELKQWLNKKTGTPVALQRLIFAGKILRRCLGVAYISPPKNSIFQRIVFSVSGRELHALESTAIDWNISLETTLHLLIRKCPLSHICLDSDLELRRLLPNSESKTLKIHQLSAPSPPFLSVFHDGCSDLVIEHIFSNLYSWKDRAAAMLVCKTWYKQRKSPRA